MCNDFKVNRFMLAFSDASFYFQSNLQVRVRISVSFHPLFPFALSHSPRPIDFFLVKSSVSLPRPVVGHQQLSCFERQTYRLSPAWFCHEGDERWDRSGNRRLAAIFCFLLRRSMTRRGVQTTAVGFGLFDEPNEHDVPC